MKKKRRKKENFSLRKEYRESWDYTRESKNFIYAIIAIFFVFSLIGFFIPAPDFIRESIIKLLEEILEKTQGMSQIELIKFIFINNAQSSFFGIIFGVLLCIFPLVEAIGNGYILGFVSLMAFEEGGISVLFRLLPHGIFELPAVFISLGLGLKFGTFIFQKNKGESFKKYFWNSLRVFLFIVIPLLIIAAIIEGILVFIF